MGTLYLPQDRTRDLLVDVGRLDPDLAEQLSRCTRQAHSFPNGDGPPGPSKSIYTTAASGPVQG